MCPNRQGPASRRPDNRHTPRLPGMEDRQKSRFHFPVTASPRPGACSRWSLAGPSHDLRPTAPASCYRPAAGLPNKRPSLVGLRCTMPHGMWSACVQRCYLRCCVSSGLHEVTPSTGHHTAGEHPSGARAVSSAMRGALYSPEVLRDTAQKHLHRHDDENHAHQSLERCQGAVSE